MDFYQYLNSKDVAEHLRRMEYQFNALECAWIVDNNYHLSLSEKSAAMNYILTMPDYVYTSEEYSNGVSVHETIRQYFEYIDTIQAELKAKDKDAIYTYSVLYDDGWVHYEAYFRDYESCITAYHKRLLQSIDPSRVTRREIQGYAIMKIPFNEQGGTITAEYRGSGLVSIYKRGDGSPSSEALYDILGTCEVYFPVPFVPGDILYDPIYHCPMVLGELPTADAGMFLMCYRVSDDGKTINDYYCELPSVCLEYYCEELKGTDIALNVISDFIKSGRNVYGKE